MNIEQANTIPLSQILNKMGQKPQKETKTRIKYLSPYRNENTPSFFVFIKNNRWYDFGDQRGGDVVELVQLYLQSQNVISDVCAALRWVRAMIDYARITPVPVLDSYGKQCKGQESTLVFKKAEPISKVGLIRYGESRGIPPSILKRYMKQVFFLNKESGKSIFALGMKNESKGYDLRNPAFKGCIRQKDITFVRGQLKPPGVHVFEGAMDFLTAITTREGKPFEDDTIILHSLNCMEKGTAYIRKYGYTYCYTWFDNDLPGRKATLAWKEFCKREHGLLHIPMNTDYLPYKDVNAAHMARLEL